MWQISYHPVNGTSRGNYFLTNKIFNSILSSNALQEKCKRITQKTVFKVKFGENRLTKTDLLSPYLLCTQGDISHSCFSSSLIISLESNPG